MILDRLRESIVTTPLVEGDGPPQSHLERFPSTGWNLKSWSYRLAEDLALKRALERSRLAEGSGWKLRVAHALTAGAYSFHQDADYKALLFTALRRRGAADPGVTVVIPEVGPFGFDLLIARCAGYRRFVAYDRDPRIIDVCRALHGGADVEYSVSSSATFSFERCAGRDHLILFPDWPHDALERRLPDGGNVVRYSFRSQKVSLRQAQGRLGVGRLDWAGLFDAMDRLD